MASSRTGDQTCVSCIGRWVLSCSAPREALHCILFLFKWSIALICVLLNHPCKLEMNPTWSWDFLYVTIFLMCYWIWFFNILLRITFLFLCMLSHQFLSGEMKLTDYFKYFSRVHWFSWLVCFCRRAVLVALLASTVLFISDLCSWSFSVVSCCVFPKFSNPVMRLRQASLFHFWGSNASL